MVGSPRNDAIPSKRTHRYDSSEGEQRCVLCTVVMHTSVTVERFFCKPSRLRFFGEPLVLRVEPGVTIYWCLVRILADFESGRRLVPGEDDRGCAGKPRTVRVRLNDRSPESDRKRPR